MRLRAAAAAASPPPPPAHLPLSSLPHDPAAVAGTALFLAFVVIKMRRRVRWGPCCCAAGQDAQAAQRQAVLAYAAVLYQAARAAPDCDLPTWRSPPSPYDASPLVAPQGSPPPPPGAAPWCRASPTTLGRANSRCSSPTSSVGSRRASPERPTVRDLVQAWGGQSGGAAAAAPGAGPGSQQQEAGEGCLPAHEARALTWAQLGVSPGTSPAASRRASENAAGVPPPPPRGRPPLPPPQGEVHAKPVFAASDWASPAAAAAAMEAGAAGGRASFSHQVQRTASRSRLSRAASFADASDALSDASAVAPAAGEGSVHGRGRESSSHHHAASHSRRGSLDRAAHGGMMPSRPSEQSLLHLGEFALEKIRE